MPLDRWISLYLAEPLRKFRLGKKKPGIPILMYHSISNDPETGISSYYRLSTSPSLFRRQMHFLRDKGYSILSIPEVVGTLNSNTSKQDRTAALTFDDGFQDFRSQAWPILRDFGFTATVFLPTGFVGNNQRPFHGRYCLNWSEVRELHSDGMQFGSHTVNHAKLYGMDWSAIRRELADSKKAIEDQLGVSTDNFAYPYAYPNTDAAFCRRFIDMLIQQGYRSCSTTWIGRMQKGNFQHVLKRLPVNGGDDIPLFQAKLEGSYDWMASAQTLLKTCKYHWPKSTDRKHFFI